MSTCHGEKQDLCPTAIPLPSVGLSGELRGSYEGGRRSTESQHPGLSHSAWPLTSCSAHTWPLPRHFSVWMMSFRLPGKETERHGGIGMALSASTRPRGWTPLTTPRLHHYTSAKQLVLGPWTNRVDRGHLTWSQGQRVLEADLTVPPSVPQVSEGSQGQGELGGYPPGLDCGGHPRTCVLAHKMSGQDEEKAEKILGVKGRLTPSSLKCPSSLDPAPRTSLELTT